MLHWNTKAQHRVHKSPTLDLIQSQFKRIHIVKTRFSNVQFSFVLGLRLEFLLQFLKQNVLHFFCGFEILRAAVVMSSIFWDITSYSPLRVNRRFEGTCRLHLQCRRICQQGTYVEAGGKQSLL
jgi:hypothetical protein